jgi:hypothetical protein
MSRAQAPFLSLGASGAFGKTLVASTWKGIPYMRKYVVPANPRTAAQIAQRDIIAAVVLAWKTIITGAVIRDAWRLKAQYAASPMSGFNAFTSSASKIAVGNPDASYASLFAEASQVVTVTMKNIDDGATGDEAGNFEVWVGASVGGMVNTGLKTIVAGDITTDDLGDTGDVVFVEIRKDSQSRSGIYKVTLTA